MLAGNVLSDCSTVNAMSHEPSQRASAHTLVYRALRQCQEAVRDERGTDA